MEIIEIYGSVTCPNCVIAEDLTKSENLEYKSLKVGKDFTAPELMKKIGHNVRSFPQIFVGKEYIGGLSEYKIFIADYKEKQDLSDFSSDIEL